MRTWPLILAALFAPGTVAFAEDGAYLAQLAARSRELRLAERPEWQKLLHYVPNLVTPGVHSLVDSPAFFNAPGGKTDPQAELEATLASFFSALDEAPQHQHAQCTFIGRRAWLDEQLAFDRQRMPWRDCPRYREWHAALNAERLTLVFASAYLNNPSSMYGHTLLRVDARDQDERTRLLAYAINYTANTSEQNGIAFAINGLIGSYPGTFSVLPYYLKVREYSDMENRDLWEYELAFTPEEVERVLRHAWELLPAYSWYYFFDENCSYHLLGLLQVARPELDLISPFRWWALPSDTVRAITRQPGLVARAVYRPANATIIGARLRAMSKEERGVTKELSLGKASSPDALRALAPQRAAGVLEASYDYVNYRRAIGKHDVPAPAVLARELLVARSAVPAPSQAPHLTPGPRPDEGHASSRLALGAGRRAGQDFGELRLRPTYHDVLDEDAGYVRGAQIEFFDIRLRRYGAQRPRLESFIPVNIFSVASRDEFFQPRSWRVSGGWQRSFLRDGKEALIPGIDGGAGGAWSTDNRRVLAYAMAETRLRVHHELDGGHSLGAGASVGALIDASARWRIHAYASGLNDFLGETDRPRRLGLAQRFALTRDVALRLDLRAEREGARRFGDGALSLLLYF
ncbi:MAG TPA: DUF4105 domain-containing protein [Burkholderiales bacterium]